MQDLSQQYSAAPSVTQSDRARKAVKNVHAGRVKNVLPPPRRTRRKDRINIGKIEAFDPAALGSSLVAPTPSPQITTWRTTSDLAKLYAACVALLIGETKPVAFTFDLTPEAIAKALADPAGAIDHLKRRFDVALKREFGAVPLYWFALDIAGPGSRLHIHGAFAPPAMSLSCLRRMRVAMRKAWGKWDRPGLRKQIRFESLYSAGWASYALEYQLLVSRIVGERTYTMTHPMTREAKATHEAIRSVMRGEADPVLAGYDPEFYF